MVLLNIFETTLPLTNPVLKFFLLLIIILFTPIILNKIKIPHLLGLIMAGAIISPYGLYVMERETSITLFGSVGVLYIMFLAGLEIDMNEFKKSSGKSLYFGLLTFSVPMGLGYLVGVYVFHFEVISSVLLGSIFASHTLITYPLVSKIGIAKNKAVNIAIGGTMITDTLSLMVLAVIVGMTSGDVSSAFWIRLSVSVLVFALIIAIVFPFVVRWFFKRYEDNISQYIFVLTMLFFGAVLAELAGIEAIIGAFFSGLALNRLIPRTSALMNRVEFVGNAIFIPFFLIGVGMLIDYRAFITNFDTIKVAVIMTVVATTSKFLAAWITQKTFKFSADQRRLIFGLSNARVAAALAAVLIGYNIIIGTSPTGEPIRLLNESILNGTILMILFTCTISSFITQRGAKNIALLDDLDNPSENQKTIERILIPLSNLETTDELVNLSITIKSKKNKKSLYALNIIDNNSSDGVAEKKRN